VKSMAPVDRLAATILEEAKAELQAVKLPPGYAFTFAGEEKEIDKARREMGGVFAISLAAIFLAIVLQFNSVPKALVVMATVPLGLIGAFAGIVLFQANMGFMAFLAVVSLAGVIVSHIIVLSDFIEGSLEHGMPLRQALGGYALAAIFIVVAGIWLPLVGVRLARIMLWSDSFVGTLLIAFATSMPELVTTLAALRIGAVDLALGNILGSNLFDLLIIALDDLAHLGGPIFRDVDSAHAVTGMIAAIMNCVVIAALLRPPRSRLIGTLSWAGLSLAVLYVLSAVAQSSLGP